tara:strand:- start:8143 stop:9225 length:1083 start_codon:yes stop_codon:yes gene_type:complete
VQITSISIQNFRSIVLSNIDFITPITVLCGENNAGKTTILETLYFCSTLKSFKSVSNSELIANNHKLFKISLKFLQNSINSNIYIEKSLNSSKCLYNNKKITKSALNLNYPCYSLVFGFNNILLNDSSYRRDFIDSGLFHVEPGSHKLLSLFSKSLKQRNYLLKTKNVSNINFWTNELILANNKLHDARLKYFQLLNTEFNKILDSIRIDMPTLYDDISTINMTYKKGWLENYSDVLSQNFDKDLAVGYTSAGTHRSDIEVLSKSKLVKESGSMSTLVLACLIIYLAKIRVFHVKHGFKPLLLIDDLFFGIDNKNLDTVIKLLVYSNSNIVMTAPNIYRKILKDLCSVNRKISIVDIGVK